jgi:hypothetical protein
MEYGFSYFSGANVVVRLQDMPILECAGLSVRGGETNKRPLYSYASLRFDGVARGQVIYHGELLINYVHQDYLFHAITLGLEKQAGLTLPSALPVPHTPLEHDVLQERAQEEGLEAVSDHIASAAAEFWDPDISSRELQAPTHMTYSPHDWGGGFTIQASFGRQDTAARRNGDTGLLLHGVHFLSRGHQIQISEDVCVESYSFFARDMFSIRNNTRVHRIDNGSGAQTNSHTGR